MKFYIGTQVRRNIKLCLRDMTSQKLGHKSEDVSLTKYSQKNSRRIHEISKRSGKK